MYLAVLGFLGAGKDSVARHIESREDFVKDSFARSLKDITAALFNWPRDLVEGSTEESRIWREQVDPWWAENLAIPGFTPRWALQQIGTEVFRNSFHESTWILTFKHRLETVNKGKNVIVSDCRFKNEIDMFKKLGGKFIFVDNGIRPEWYDIARIANTSTSSMEQVAALLEMQTTYAHVHRSEWDWIGTEYDVVIKNDFAEKTPETYSLLLQRTDSAIDQLR